MAWIAEEVSQRAAEYFQNKDKVEIAVRLANGQQDTYETVRMKWVEEAKEKVTDSETIRKLIRNSKKNTIE